MLAITSLLLTVMTMATLTSSLHHHGTTIVPSPPPAASPNTPRHSFYSQPCFESFAGVNDSQLVTAPTVLLLPPTLFPKAPVQTCGDLWTCGAAEPAAVELPTPNAQVDVALWELWRSAVGSNLVGSRIEKNTQGLSCVFLLRLWAVAMMRGKVLHKTTSTYSSKSTSLERPRPEISPMKSLLHCSHLEPWSGDQWVGYCCHGAGSLLLQCDLHGQSHSHRNVHRYSHCHRHNHSHRNVHNCSHGHSHRIAIETDIVMDVATCTDRHSHGYSHRHRHGKLYIQTQPRA